MAAAANILMPKSCHDHTTSNKFHQISDDGQHLDDHDTRQENNRVAQGKGVVDKHAKAIRHTRANTGRRTGLCRLPKNGRRKVTKKKGKELAEKCSQECVKSDQYASENGDGRAHEVKGWRVGVAICTGGRGVGVVT